MRPALLAVPLCMTLACASATYDPSSGGQAPDMGSGGAASTGKDGQKAGSGDAGAPRRRDRGASAHQSRKDGAMPDRPRPDMKRADMKRLDKLVPDKLPPKPDKGACGNGKLDPGETCDRAIAKGIKGACPTSCPDDGKPCTLDKFVGARASCTLRCVHQLQNPCCGDGKRAGAEQCDDGNKVDTDMCTNKCAWPGGQLLISEVVLTPTGSEMIEIFNPTGKTVALDSVYLADMQSYHLVVQGKKPAHSSDFIARFPSGAKVGPGQFRLVALAGSAQFHAAYGRKAHFELVPSDPKVPDMVPATAGAIGSAATLTNSGELLALFSWDGVSDRVKDLDYLIWGPSNAVNKSGVCLDGPDPGTKGTCYRGDTGAAAQSRLAVHSQGGSLHRCHFGEGKEKKAGGNGASGHDETSEPLKTTWAVNPATASKRTPAAGPPKGLCP